FDEDADKRTAGCRSGINKSQSAQSLRKLEGRSRTVSEAASRCYRKTSRMGPKRTSPRVSRHYLFSVWHAVDHGKFLAGLVRHHSFVCRFADGLARRAATCCSSRSMCSDLCK